MAMTRRPASTIGFIGLQATNTIGLYEGQALRVTGEHTQILTSDRSRGTTPPLFLNDTREEIACEMGVPKDVSRIFAVRDTRGAPR